MNILPSSGTKISHQMRRGTNDLQKHLVKRGYFLVTQDGKRRTKIQHFSGELPNTSTFLLKLKTHVTAVTAKRLKDILGG